MKNLAIQTRQSGHRHHCRSLFAIFIGASLLFSGSDAEAGRAYGVRSRGAVAVGPRGGVAASRTTVTTGPFGRTTATRTTAVSGPRRNTAVKTTTAVAGPRGAAVVTGGAVVGTRGAVAIVRPAPVVVVAPRLLPVVVVAPRPLPVGYIAVLPVGHRVVVYGGRTCYFVGGVYYAPEFYEGTTVYVVVH